MKPST